MQEEKNKLFVPTRQQAVHEIPIRTYADMANEAAKTLAELPRYTAVAKLLQEENGREAVTKQRINTLPPDYAGSVLHDWDSFLHRVQGETVKHYCTPREEIEQELRERQERWRRQAIKL